MNGRFNDSGMNFDSRSEELLTRCGSLLPMRIWCVKTFVSKSVVWSSPRFHFEREGNECHSGFVFRRDSHRVGTMSACGR